MKHTNNYIHTNQYPNVHHPSVLLANFLLANIASVLGQRQSFTWQSNASYVVGEMVISLCRSTVISRKSVTKFIVVQFSVVWRTLPKVAVVSLHKFLSKSTESKDNHESLFPGSQGSISTHHTSSNSSTQVPY